jgi:hypothetical protein
MEFFIKKNATLPVLKINVIKDGRSDYDRSMRFLQQTDIFFSMVNTATGIPKITSRPAGVIEQSQLSASADTLYFVYYQFTPFDTKDIGRYKAQFLIRNETGVLNLPLNQEIFINVTDSFILDDMEYQTCYVVDFPCCKQQPRFVPNPPPNDFVVLDIPESELNFSLVITNLDAIEIPEGDLNFGLVITNLDAIEIPEGDLNFGLVITNLNAIEIPEGDLNFGLII